MEVDVDVEGRPSNYHQNPISWPMQCRVPDPNPASSFVLVQLPAFCQRLFAKLIPKKVSQTCDLKQSVSARLEQPTLLPKAPPYIYPSAKSNIQKDSPFALFCSTASAAAAVVCPAGSCRHLSSAQLCSASTQFVTIPFCGLIFALLVSLSYLALPSPLSLTQSLPGCAFICLVALPDLACLLFVLFVSALYLN